MKIAFLGFVWKTVYPYLVVGKIAILLAIGLTIIHCNELSHRFLRTLKAGSKQGMNYADRIN